jgi:hypothetical protein
MDPALHDVLQRWAAAEFRSLNAQIEFALRQAAVAAGRLRPTKAGDEASRKE